MKHALILSFALLAIKGYSSEQSSGAASLLAVPTYTYHQVNKIKGGLFGYKSVSTTTDNNGNKITNCQNPGTHRCKADYVVVDGIEWSAEQADELDNFVTGQVRPEHTSGTVLYKDRYVVSFYYSIDDHALSYNLYTLHAAQEAGIWP